MRRLDGRRRNHGAARPPAPQLALLVATIVAALGTSVLCLSTLPLQETVPRPLRSHRRQVLGGLLGAPLAAAAPPAARAEANKRGFQLKLPTGWAPYKQGGIPGLGDLTPRELLVAGDAGQLAEVKVVRVPLATSPRDPQALGGLAIIDFFSTPRGQEPRVTKPQVVDVLSKGFAQQPAIISFALVGSPTETFRNTTKYLRYDFEASRCEGAQVQGVGGKICQRSDSGEVLPTVKKHHAILSALVEEPANDAKVADGMLVGPGGAEVLWVLDISAPAETWPKLTEQVELVLASFGVGSEGQLAATREAAVAAPTL